MPLCEKLSHVAVPTGAQCPVSKILNWFRERLLELEEDRDMRIVILTGDGNGSARRTLL